MVKWTPPQQTRALVEALVTTFGAARLEVVMEPSGTYGDALRALFVDAGVKVYRISPKRVHDAAELYDGVPSLHDAKAAYLIGRLHLEGVSQPWAEPSASRRALTAQLGLLDLYQERWRAAASIAWKRY
jgi:transposase